MRDVAASTARYLYDLGSMAGRGITVLWRMLGIARPLIGFVVMVALTWTFYHKFSAAVTPTTDFYLLSFIALISLECVVVMLVYTRRWRVLALGLLGFFLATWFLYARVSSAGIMGPPSPPIPPHPTYGYFQGRSWLELTRALYLDAAILVGVGLNRWAWRHRREAFPWRRNVPPRPIFFAPEQDDLP